MNRVVTLIGKTALLTGAVVLISVIVVGCSQYSRYDKNTHGDMVKSSTKEWNANLAAHAKETGKQQQQKALAAGQKLFNDANLGGNGQSCNSCHPGGGTTGGEVTVAKKMGLGPYTMPIPPLIGAAASYPKYKVPNAAVISLQQMSNNCIRMFMDGKRLPEDSPESLALLTYLSSLSDGEAIHVGEDGSSR